MKYALHIPWFRTLLLFVLLAAPVLVFGEEGTFQPLQPLPKDIVDTTSFADFLSGIFTISIIVAGMLAVGMLVYGGFLYAMSDAFTTKDKAKKTMWNAVIGLLIVVGSVLILETINPNITNLDIFRDAAEVTVEERRETAFDTHLSEIREQREERSDTFYKQLSDASCDERVYFYGKQLSSSRVCVPTTACPDDLCATKSTIIMEARVPETSSIYPRDGFRRVCSERGGETSARKKGSEVYYYCTK